MSKFEMNSFSLKGKVALVTGASYGIGFAIATALAEAGATICFNDLKQEFVDKGLAAYKELGIEAHGYVCDVTDEEGVNAMVAQIKEEVGSVDILVNNAALWRDFMIHAFSHEGMEGFYLWGFKDGDTYATHSLFYDELGNRKPCIDQWEDLIYNKWWTRDAKATTDAERYHICNGLSVHIYSNIIITIEASYCSFTFCIALVLFLILIVSFSSFSFV